MVLAVVCVGGFVERATGQISPGELAAPHKSLEGVKNCLKCHALGQGPSVEKCLDCHKEIAVQMDRKRGYHFRTVSVAKQSCFECHNDHAGRDFDLVHWPKGINGFDHEETGYALQGAHGDVKCRKCHVREHVAEDIRTQQSEIDLDRTFLGLSQTCLACHADEHRGQLAADCVTCHDFHAWKPAPLFDHKHTKYPLTGKHRQVQCSKCHPVLRDAAATRKEDKTYVKYADIASQTCGSCHKDVHQGKLGTDCAKCHQTTGWLQIASSSFDHNVTRFPLRGLHAKVPCEKCHGEGTRMNQIAFARCSDCHKDPHSGQFARRTDGGVCEACHNEDGFVPASFTLVDHEKTRYPLTGAHLAQPCIACHTEIADSGGGARRYVFADLTCEGCHSDIHLAQFQKYGTPKNCEDCHRITLWADLDFDHNRDATYALVGAHQSVRCQGCHQTFNQRGTQVVRYRPLGHACATCHDVQPAALN